MENELLGIYRVDATIEKLETSRLNRKERRAAAKMRGRGVGQPRGAAPADTKLKAAVSHHQAGRLAEAKRLYTEILSREPNNVVALHFLGVIAYQEGDAPQATALIGKALALRPDQADAHNNLGLALKVQGKLDEAVAAYHEALKLKPSHAEAYNNLGLALKDQGKLDEAVAAHHEALKLKPDHAGVHSNLGSALADQGKLDEAVAAYHTALKLKPDHAEAHNNLGIALNYQGRLEEAVAAYRKALELKPDYADAHNNLGNVLSDQGKLDEAVAAYHEALKLKPDYADAHSNLAIVLHSCGRQSEALDHFRNHLDLGRGDNPIDPQHESFRFITKVKMNHDIEQFRYLASLGPETGRFLALAEVYEAVDTEIEWPSDDGMAIPLRDDHRQRLGDTYNRPIHLHEAPVVTGSTLSSSLDVDKITADYFAHASGMTYFDDLLSSDALASLRRFLLCSTIWFDFTHQVGYLGAMLKDGLACPLLLQIADDLRQTFPDIFKDHQLTQLWAYKYDSRLPGIQVHADFAAINVNFWITPDKANLNPATGGLVVYDAEALLDWHFQLYNRDTERIRKFLAEHESGRIVVPYGENRIVLFNSNLFHETDSIDFKPGYEYRRINITMLFGRRQD